ncbi:MAG: hypothetical protein QXD97_02675 [Acidilobaceae archaeon]
MAAKLKGIPLASAVGVGLGVFSNPRSDARYDLTILTLGSPGLPDRVYISVNNSSHVLGSPNPLSLTTGPISLTTSSSRLAYLPAYTSLNFLTISLQSLAIPPLLWHTIQPKPSKALLASSSVG